MILNNNPNSAKTGGFKSALTFLAILAVVFSALFIGSFHPDKVVFSNDGPLGSVVAECRSIPEIMTGVWVDSNWLGGPEPTPTPGPSLALRLVTTPVMLDKLYAPVSLMIIACCAYIFFWRMKFSPMVCLLGGLAVGLNSDFVGTSCWGVCSQPIAFGMNLLALAALADLSTPLRCWLGAALGGFSVGLGIVEGYDQGALFSLFIASFVAMQAIVSDGPFAKRILLCVGRLVVVVVCSVFISAAALSTLIGTQVKGVVGMGQDAESKAARWSQAAQFSIPKAEALGIVVPGLFGFRRDTAGGGAYWGRGGSDMAWDGFLQSNHEGRPPGGTFRAGAGSNYAGVLVLLITIFGIAQSFRKHDGVFTSAQRKLIWFWSFIALVAALLMFGRFAPFYKFFYALPYASTIRNPAKFLHVLEWSLLIIFGYGAEALCRVGFGAKTSPSSDVVSHWKSWWSRATGFDRRWVKGSLAALGVFVLAWVGYETMRGQVESHIAEMTRLEYLARGQTVEASAAAGAAKATVSFSIGQVGRSVIVLAASVGLVALVVSGWFGGKRAKLGGMLLVFVLVADLALIAREWVVMVNWKEKYETNSVIEFLKNRAYEQRVALFPSDRFVDMRRLPQDAQRMLQQFNYFTSLYGQEWTQHLFLYHNIQTLDIIQEPRMATDKAAFESVTYFVPLRRWQLTNTRYLIGPTAFLELLNQQIDTGKSRFKIAMQFSLAAKPGADTTSPSAEQITTVISTNGPIAVFEFTGALPRAKLYSNWKVSTNDTATLQAWSKQLQQRVPPEWAAALASQPDVDLATLHELADEAFDPLQTVLLSEPLSVASVTNQVSGEVKFESYAPKRIVLSAKATGPCVLLLNDKFDANWKVTVNDQPVKLLRANFIARGVFLDKAGEHRVEFKFQPSVSSLYVSWTACGLALVILIVLIVNKKKPTPAN